MGPPLPCVKYEFIFFKLTFQFMLRNNSASNHEKCECSDVQNDDVCRYTREKMLSIRDLPLSGIRPKYLSTEFDKLTFFVSKAI